MEMTGNYGVSDELLGRIHRNEQERKRLDNEVNETALKHLGLKPGVLMRHKFNGLVYKVNSFQAYRRGSYEIMVSVVAYRYYMSGRRESTTARSMSFLSFEDLETM